MTEKEALLGVMRAVCALAERLTGEKLVVAFNDGQEKVWLGDEGFNHYWVPTSAVSDAPAGSLEAPCSTDPQHTSSTG